MKSAALLILPLALVLACTVEEVSDDDDGGGGGGGSGGSGGTVDPGTQGLPILGSGTHDIANMDVQVLATGGDGLLTPRDMAFNPLVPDELWIVNMDNSIVVVSMSGQGSQRYSGSGSTHFLAKPSAIAFSGNGNFATAQDQDEVTQPGDSGAFMGPTLWTSNRAIFDGGTTGHIDMLHNTPSGKGIAWERDNTFWVFDGFHNSITRYEFHSDHGPGGSDHTDGVVVRYVEEGVAADPNISSHMAFDPTTNRLYIADTGNARVAVLETLTGAVDGLIYPNFDASWQTRFSGAELTTLIGDASDIGLNAPSGLELHGGYIFVTDTPSATVFAFTMEGELVDWLHLGTSASSLQGIAFDRAGNLYATDTVANTLMRISPKVDL